MWIRGSGSRTTITERWIRIHFSQMWVPGSGSTSKWDGSETLLRKNWTKAKLENYAACVNMLVYLCQSVFLFGYLRGISRKQFLCIPRPVLDKLLCLFSALLPHFLWALASFPSFQSILLLYKYLDSLNTKIQKYCSILKNSASKQLFIDVFHLIEVTRYRRSSGKKPQSKIGFLT